MITNMKRHNIIVLTFHKLREQRWVASQNGNFIDPLFQFDYKLFWKCIKNWLLTS